jgi:formylglycine-generating enzyme required for sulfatase activity
MPRRIGEGTVNHLLAAIGAMLTLLTLSNFAAAQQCCTGNVSTYCTAGTSVQGCAPAIRGEGVPDTANATGFEIVVRQMPGQRMGLLFYGMSAIPQPQPWALGSSSYLCVYYPVSRTGARPSGGTAGSCDGELRIDFNAFMATNPSALGGPFTAGQQFIAQGWYRDPGAAKGTNLSDALRFSLCTNAGDTTPPVITTCAPNQTVSADANCQGVVPDFTSSVVASDNCTPVTITQFPALGAAVPLGVNVITISVTDGAGNVAQCAAVLTVSDTTGPAITWFPGQVSVPVGVGCQLQVPDVASSVVAFDPCGAISLTQFPSAGSMFGPNLRSIVTTVTDAAGNSSLCRTTITAVGAPACGTAPALVAIQPGTFIMGSSAAPGWPYYNGTNTQPAHEVTITYPFYMGRYEVTQAEYQSLMGANPSYFVGTTRPVDQVGWSSARAYCAALTSQQAALGLVPVGFEYRLPTEAEWEYSCRSGTTTEFSLGTSLQCGEAVFRYSDHSQQPCYIFATQSVGQYSNPWGLSDMHGNVWEWCLDSYAPYAPGAKIDPFVTGGVARVSRGGCWDDYSADCRSAARRGSVPPGPRIGFRVVLGPILVP